MNDWYYAQGGQQVGPVSFEKIAELARNGGLDPVKDLVWNSTMKDWLPAGQVEGLFGQANPVTSAVVPVSDPSNPYAAPNSAWSTDSQLSVGVALEEIPPGSEPIDVGACVKRGFDLAVRNIGMVLVISIIFLMITFTVSGIQQAVMMSLGVAIAPSAPSTLSPEAQFSQAMAVSMHASNIIGSIIQQLISIFLTLGATRIGLNLVSGKEITIGMLFGGGKKLLPALGASILYGLMVAVGCLFLIVPGIYLALRYGQFLSGMVDRDLGVMESFAYSSSITTNNRMNLFLLVLLYFVIILAGCLALCVGLIFAYPVIMLSGIVAYRWMQYGHRAALDYPGTTTPMLSKL
jgi:GYF domain 2